MSWTCFVVEKTNKFVESLRRYAGEKKCPGKMTYHNASVKIGVIEWETKWNGMGDDSFPHDDPRWPKKCDYCDYEFVDEDRWQYNRNIVMRCPKTKRKFTLDELPAGAMWYDDWWPGEPGPDGKHLYVRLPCGSTWHLDDSRKLWTRTGVPPLVTASPSILTPGYHGFLQNGVLTGDLDGGRKYPG